MKSNPKPADEYTNFQNGLRQVLSVSKEELNRRIAADNASRADKPGAPHIRDVRMCGINNA